MKWFAIKADDSMLHDYVLWLTVHFGHESYVQV